MKASIQKLMKLFLLLLLIGGLTTSCDSDDDQASVAVKITDDPFPVQFINSVDMAITKIELKDTNGNYVTVFEGSKVINVADYTNGSTADITISTIPDGTYNAARITVGTVSITLTDNNVFDFNASGSIQTEVQIGPALEVQNGEYGNLLFDIDLADSIDFSGTFMGDWISNVSEITGLNDFKPDFRAVDLDKTGSISGTVTDINGNAVAYARVEVAYDYNGDGLPESVSTHTEADGSFQIIGLPEGSYTLEIDSENDGSKQVDNVGVSIKQNTTVNVTMPVL